MKWKNELIFWVAVIFLLTVVFSGSLGSLTTSFFFVCFLFPVILSTSIFFKRFLIPRYLLPGKRIRFGVYFLYMMIISIYLEMLVLTMAFIILADYQIENLGSMAGDIYILATTLYLIVFIKGFIDIMQTLKMKSNEVHALQEQAERNARTTIQIKVNRKHVVLAVDDIVLIESLGDYLNIHTPDTKHITRMKLSSIHQELPDQFVRIHRSFIVNKAHVDSFNREEVMVKSKAIPIGRTYKKATREALGK